MRFSFLKQKRGVTLLETLISITILLIIAVSVYRGFSALLDILGASRTRIAAAQVANEQIEIIRNLPYASVGTVGGAPTGVITALVTKEKGGLTFTIETTIRNVDDPFDGLLGGSPNDLSPADYKLIELNITCVLCDDPTTFTFTGRAAPKGLETASTNGALFVQVVDANGQAVSGATVTITNTTVVPNINITDVTDASGFLKIIDAPPAVQSYRITVSKSGYSSDQTYTSSVANPNPTKPHVTVAIQTVTQATFSIDRVSTINASSLTQTCGGVGSFDFRVTGSKLIGTAPDVPKFNQTVMTNSSGLLTLNTIEWGNYVMDFTLDSNLDVLGTIPGLPLTVNPNSTQDFKIITGPKNPRALVVTVRDATNSQPLANASVVIDSGPYSAIKTTGKGSLTQTDWSGGDGQLVFGSDTQYFSQDGNIVTNNPVGDITLAETEPSVYAASGNLTSSLFDTGSPSNFFHLTWEPISQPAETNVKFQIASATTTTPFEWTYLGPDGTEGTYYTTSGTAIAAEHNGDQYIRYRAFLETASTTFTPSISDVGITFASDCVPPGQAYFGGLAIDTYNVDVTIPGFAPESQLMTVNNDWQELEVMMNPQ
ncbi:MAG: carboxypeptidase regulatory-like domain-containing protein [Patescibacteria group bacterium]